MIIACLLIVGYDHCYIDVDIDKNTGTNISFILKYNYFNGYRLVLSYYRKLYNYVINGWVENTQN